MLARLKAAGLVWPTIMTLLALPVLVQLGAWQWHRMQWKADLIDKIHVRANGPAIDYAQANTQFSHDGEAEYQKVSVTGTFNHAQERYLYAPNREAQGWNVYTLFQPTGGAPPVFVNRGWVPDRLKDPATRPQGQIAGDVEVVGLLRGPETPGMFELPSDPQRNLFYWRDLNGMRWAPNAPPTPDQLATLRLAAYAPFSIDALAEPANPGGWPRGGATEVNLPNRHLEYVVTWWGLAATLLLVYAAYARGRLRAKPAPGDSGKP